MTSSSDITLIGGGALGLLAAREFYAAGATVTVIDQGFLGKESSWAGGGILLPLYPWRQDPAISDLVKQSFSLYPTLATELIEDTSIDPEWHPCGLLITQTPDIVAARDWCNHYGVAYQPANDSLLAGLTTTPNHPLWLPEIAQIRNPRLIKSLKQDLLQKGVKLLEKCEVTGINLEQGKIKSVSTNAGKLAINQLIITAGAWTAKVIDQFLPSLRADKPKISPVKGQMVLFAAEPNTLRTIVLDGDHYLIPRLDGHILAGSTVEQNEAFDKSPSAAGKTELSEFALNLLPTLKNFPLVKHWAGLRPGTPNGIPYIGKHPEIENLSINAGHFRNGLAMAPASAQLIADLILNRPTKVNPEAYRLDRLT